ncbi:unnamed protein product [Penicillium pancosmium]
MNRILQVSAALLAALPSVMAGTCYAIGYVNMNTAGGGIGGGAVSTVMGIQLFDPDNRQIAWWQPRLNSDDPSVCGDFVAVETGNLTQVFEWGATCAPGFTECHGAYGDQTHIDGESPQGSTDYYGLGVSADSECRVNFEC